MTIENEVSLHTALAWIATRNQDFLTEYGSRAFYVFESLLPEYNATHRKNVKALVATYEEAWESLKSASLEGKIGIWGYAFEKGHHINEVGLFDTPYELERAVWRVGPPRRIQRASLETLVIEMGAAEFRLRPKNWFGDGGYWWKDIEVRWTELTHAFSETVANVQTPTSFDRLDDVSPLQRGVIEAVEAVWPNGAWRAVPVGRRREPIEEWLSKQAKSDEKKHVSVSPSTISRAFKRLKNKHY